MTLVLFIRSTIVVGGVVIIVGYLQCLQCTFGESRIGVVNRLTDLFHSLCGRTDAHTESVISVFAGDLFIKFNPR